MPWLNAPNTITVARLLAVPVVAQLVVRERYGAALVAFLLAGASDAVDGFLARVLDRRTALGATLDPAADWLLLVAAFAALWWVGQLPGWLVAVVFVRDLVLAGLYWGCFAIGWRLPVRPSPLGKLTTAIQLVLLAWVLWVAAGPGSGAARAPVPAAAFGVIGALTVISGLHYLFLGYGMVRGQGKGA